MESDSPDSAEEKSSKTVAGKGLKSSSKGKRQSSETELKTILPIVHF